MEIKIIGCGDAFGSGGQFNTATLVTSPAGVCLLDCGASTMIALNGQAINPNSIDMIVLTHLHGDHFGGVPFFLLDAQWIRARKTPLLIAGPPGTQKRLGKAIEILFPGTAAHTPWSFSWHIQEITPGAPIKLQGYTVSTVAVKHDCGAPATAVRLDDGTNSFVHSGDTEWTDALVPLCKGADMVFLDCFAFEEPALTHMNYQLLLKKRHLFDAKQVILTHMGPQMLANRHHVDTSQFTLAEDGARYIL